jgi:hypothetical protein
VIVSTEFDAGVLAAREKIALILWRSQKIADSGMYSNGFGSQDASERSYHRGLEHAIGAVESLLIKAN